MDKLFKGTVKKAYLVNLTNKEVCILSLILALGISLRLFIYNNYIKYPDHDTYFYIQLAKNIISGFGNYLPYDFTDVGLLKQPLYSLIIAIFHIFISDWPAAALLANVSLQSLLVFPLYFIAREIFNETCGYIACLIYSANVYFLAPRQSYGIFAFFLCLTAALILSKKRGLVESFLLGSLFALLWFSRYEALIFIPFFFVVYIFKIGRLRTGIIAALIVLSTFCLFVYGINSKLNPRTTPIEKLRYRAIFNFFPIMQHFLPSGWDSSKTIEVERIAELADSKPQEALAFVTKRCVNRLPEIYVKNLFNSFKTMNSMTLNFFLLIFATAGVFLIKHRPFIIGCALLPFIYAPYCTPFDNAQYTQISAILIMVLSSAGIYWLTSLFKKIPFSVEKKRDVLARLFLIAVVLFLSIGLFKQKFPVVMNYTYTESNYEYKKLFSEKQFIDWIDKYIPARARILAPEEISRHLLFNDYRLFISLHGTIDYLVAYAKKLGIEYYLLDKEVLICDNYPAFSTRLKIDNHSFNLIGIYRTNGKIFYLLKINLN